VTVIKKLISIIICLFPLFTHAVDIIRYNPPHSKLDLRNTYPLQIISAALEATRAEYGDYIIEYSPVLLRRDRALQELHKGKLINIYAAPSAKIWEQSITPIYFPILRGLLNYRRLLINKEDAQRFAALQSIEQLKSFKAGLGLQWSTTKTLQSQNFDVVTSNSYEGLFFMLHRRRFDYIIRGINEVYYEFSERTKKFPEMIIEETKVLHLPLPVFLFVSPSQPRLQERIEKGLWIIHKNGVFDQIFHQFHDQSIRRSDIKNKTVFDIESNQITPHPIYNNPELWFNPLDY
tara:strand:+ start:3340 stop:4212 length:873 start_codon:yes stop_codon:yes gene_type:complete